MHAALIAAVVGITSLAALKAERLGHAIVSVTPRPIRGVWPSLTVAQTEELTARFAALSRQSVQVHCARPDCTALARDIEDVLANVGWRVTEETTNIPWAPRSGIAIGPVTGSDVHAATSRFMAQVMKDVGLATETFETGDTGDMVIVIGRNTGS